MIRYIIDAEDLHTAPDKIDAIKNALRPENLHQLRSFLGLVNYYGKFLSALSTTTHPLNHLMQANHQWRWSDDCETAFKKLKEQLCARPILTHYDPKLSLKLARDRCITIWGRCSNCLHWTKINVYCTRISA